MRIAKISIRGGSCGLGILVFLSNFLIFPTQTAVAQTCTPPSTTGFNVVYGSYCGGSATYQGAFAMVDATQFGSTDICVAMQSIFGINALANAPNTYNPGNSNGVVIDARGYTGALNCSVNPWVDPTNMSWDWTGSFSTVVLLPAGSIKISQTLALPHNTRLVGEGPGLTTLVAATGFSSTYIDMIDMGTSSAPGYPTICAVASGSFDCPAVVIEHLTLNGNGQQLNGIVNRYSQELSRVNDVALTNFTGGSGLWLNDHSDNSGPYTNISYSGSGVCLQAFNSDTGLHSNLNQTRGIHGLSCAMSGSETTPAIYLDSPNNSLEDVYISGNSSQDGILIGYQASAYNNILFNVQGSGLKDVITISTAHNVNDLTILGLTCTGSPGTCPGNSINDVPTGTTLTDSNVGTYIIGEPVTAGGSTIGHSRFTTSVNHSSTAGAVSWLVGQKQASGSCAAGTLYSCTNGSYCNVTGELYTLWECIGGSAWTAIK